MALDATPAGAASDSYLTVAAADAFAAADLGRHATAWAAASTDQKERALKRATRDLDSHIGTVFAQFDPDTPQALLFPRSRDTDTNGNPVIPVVLKKATYEQAIFVLAAADVLDDAGTRRARGLSNFAEPNVSGQHADDPGYGTIAPRALRTIRAGSLDESSLVGWIETT